MRQWRLQWRAVWGGGGVVGCLSVCGQNIQPAIFCWQSGKIYTTLLGTGRMRHLSRVRNVYIPIPPQTHKIRIDYRTTLRLYLTVDILKTKEANRGD